MLAVIIYRSIIRLSIQYPTIANKQSNHPFTVVQIKLRNSQPEYHHLIPKIIPPESLTLREPTQFECELRPMIALNSVYRPIG